MRDKLRSVMVAGALFFGAIGGSMVGFGGGIPLIPSTPQYSEPSQIVGTLNAFINQLNGFPLGSGGYAAQPNSTVSLGLYCQNAAAGASPQTCNGTRGAVSYTGLGVAATGTVMTTVISDTSITTQSNCTAAWQTAFTAGSGVTVATIVPTANTLTVISVNAGTTTNAVTTGTLGFQCFN
jgi:hypothetical protein